MVLFPFTSSVTFDLFNNYKQNPSLSIECTLEIIQWNHSIIYFYRSIFLYPNNSSLNLQVANYKRLIMQFNDVKIIHFSTTFCALLLHKWLQSCKVHLIFVHCCCFITFPCIVLSLVSLFFSKTLFSNCYSTKKTYYSLFDCLFKQTQFAAIN